MKGAKDLANAIKGITATQDGMLGTVVSVDKTNNTCEVDVDGNEFGNVRLQSVVDMERKGCRFYPAVDSDVLIVPINENGDWEVRLFSEIEQVLFEIGDMSFDLSSSGLILNGGQLGGMIKIEALVSDMNSIKTDLNNLKTKFNNWTPTPSDGGLALKTLITTWAEASIARTEQADIEDTKVKH